MFDLRSQPSGTWVDLRALQAEIPTVRSAAPVLRRTLQVLSEEQNWTTSVQGTTADYLSIRTWPLDHGTAMTDSDVDSGTKVAVLGQTVVEKLFGANSDPVGQVVRINNVPFSIVGVLGKKGQSPVGQDYDDVVLVPVTTFQQRIQGGLKNYLSGTIVVGATTAATTDRAQRAI